MRAFEWVYLAAEPCLLPLHREVRRRLLAVARAATAGLRILDVGGRKSPYTIGVPAQVTVSDLPRSSDLQRKLNLGMTPEMAARLLARRSNISEVVFEDMTDSRLPGGAFDCVVAVEVLEHVDADEAFVRHAHRVLKPQGVLLMTTPNGETIPNRNPDHKRHYTREQLTALLGAHFRRVSVEYAVRKGRLHRWGLASWSMAHPWHTARAMLANLANDARSRDPAVRRLALGTCYLLAAASKGGPEAAQGQT